MLLSYKRVFEKTVDKMQHIQQFYVLTVLPVLVSNWCIRIPMVVLIYCFPTSLQLPLGILAVAIWSMLLAALVYKYTCNLTQWTFWHTGCSGSARSVQLKFSHV